ncbi:TetR/AcrR family transcriptional regulator [[Mycobacterium] burgundiense]|uniref:Helix-turn-helix domain-containing protein n=1 Tax=[Mycobacterium] burgundiense TaxID=3064286 RepID=A0ABM9LHQ8_9MYCO|nr:TetR/AcrR family transcriptional regulator [Mycolicibacterium sp. MU0053]CAJ1499218.1 helix-turn-helix domain-containing protein [Mycolicibacterium sp. MU0053]
MTVPSEAAGNTPTARPKRALQERSRIAKQRILDAAVRVLHQHGYAKTSTLRIQEEAGVSRGGLLNHFPSRDQLLVAAVHHLAIEWIRGLGTRTQWADDPAERIAEAIDTMWATYSQPYFWASVELWVAARSHEDLRLALLPEEHITGSVIRASTDVLFGPALSSHPAYPAVREMLVTSMRGVALTYAIETRDPAKDPHVRDWNAVARAMLLET